ncbi:membrane protein [Clostridium acetobutylicum]|nr:membrane protein [Clostridium acetobutylicum]
MDIIDIIENSLRGLNMWSIVDILVVTYIFYKTYSIIKETRAMQLLKGVLLIILLIPLSDIFHLTMLNWILQRTITIGVLSMVIIFQPEIRRALEKIGRSAFVEGHILQDKDTVEKILSEVVTSVKNLAESKTGALIIVEQSTGLEDIIGTGTRVDAKVSAALLENIFVVNTPLHDGATIIRNDRIAAAGCFLPLTANNDINKKLGTRHRAGIGISENSDALVIIVSEETGNISLAINGRLTRNYTPQKLKDILMNIIINRYTKKITFWEKVKGWRKRLNKK